MNHSLVAVRYAKALFQLANEKGSSEVVYNELLAIGKVLTSNPSLAIVLNSPVYKQSQKTSVVKQLFEKRCLPITLQFLLLVIAKGRENLLHSIIRDYGDFYRQEKGIKKVLYTSAVLPLPTFETELRQKLESLMNCKVELTIKQNKALIGGFELLVDNKLLDASISSQLKKMQKRLLSL